MFVGSPGWGVNMSTQGAGPLPAGASVGFVLIGDAVSIYRYVGFAAAAGWCLEEPACPTLDQSFYTVEDNPTEINVPPAGAVGNGDEVHGRIGVTTPIVEIEWTVSIAGSTFNAVPLFTGFGFEFSYTQGALDVEIKLERVDAACAYGVEFTFEAG